MNEPVVLSAAQVAPILAARSAGEAAAVTSLDLGLTVVSVALAAERVVFPGGQWLPWDRLEEIKASELVCFSVGDGVADKIMYYSDLTNRLYSLVPTDRAPTMLVSGIPMHRIKGIDPHQDTLKKVRTIAPLSGRVLDTCTGLGYTAMKAAETAEEVVTIELDPTVLKVARLNPWSRPLFESPCIRQIIGDTFEEVQDLGDESFARIVHDPPMFSLAGELYSGECYRQLHRVLKSRGRMFHYIGDLSSRSGRNIARGVVRRLQDAGFVRIVRRPEAFGVVAYK